MTFRGFTSSDEFSKKNRTIEDAPAGLRHEFVDILFHVCEHNEYSPKEPDIFKILCQTSGESAAEYPDGGWRAGASRVVDEIEWPRFYDLILRFFTELERKQSYGLEEYVEGVNRVLAAHGIAWELTADGRLQRVLPATAKEQVIAAMEELSSDRFAAASKLLASACDAYNDRPRRDRDACANAFDAMESTAKERFSMPTATFGAVMKKVREEDALHPSVCEFLKRIEVLRHNDFGHGPTTGARELSKPEVDFTYLSCVAGIVLFARMP